MIPTLITERLTLKMADESDADAIAEFVNRNKAFLAEWEPSRESDYYTRASQLQMIRDERARVAGGQMAKFWLFKGDAAIGSASLNNIVRGAFQSCHLGYRIDEREQGKGYMTEALAAVVAHAFSDLRLHRIEANIMPRNKASLRVVAKLGFYEEGMARKYLKINGKWEDHLHMVLRNAAMEEGEYSEK